MAYRIELARRLRAPITNIAYPKVRSKNAVPRSGWCRHRNERCYARTYVTERCT
jgi:hypothetical protein